MNSVKNIKIVATVLVLLIILFSILSFGVYLNQVHDPNNSAGRPITFFVYTFLVILFVIFLFSVLIILANKKEEVKTVYLSSTNTSDEEKDTKDQTILEEEDLTEWFSEMLQKVLPESDLEPSQFASKLLRNLSSAFQFVQGLYFKKGDDDVFRLEGDYAYFSEEKPREFTIGETLSGQAAKNRKLLNISEVPEGYITILSGLGKGYPRQLIILPVISDGESKAIIELASFQKVDEKVVKFLAHLTEEQGNKLIK